MVETNFVEKKSVVNPTVYLIEKCLDLTRLGNDYGTVMSPSGRKINFKINKEVFELSDEEYGIYHLKSRILHQDICTFDLATKKELPFHNINFINNRHPDFMASEYVKKILEYYNLQNINIRAIRSIWTNQSDNHMTFIEELKKTRNPIQAAKATYSGKLFSELGYSHIPLQNLNMNYENSLARFPQLITVDFFKK